MLITNNTNSWVVYTIYNYYSKFLSEKLSCQTTSTFEPDNFLKSKLFRNRSMQQLFEKLRLNQTRP
jgi:hypothetical protein